jgi:NADPH-dependent curcumin reductase CurA
MNLFPKDKLTYSFSNKAMSITETKVWVLQNPPTDHAVLSGPNATFSLKTQSLPALEDGQVLLKTVYISNDPAQRGWIDGNGGNNSYVTPLTAGETMRASGICEVVESKDDKFQKGALVMTSTGWSEYLVRKAAEVRPLRDIPGVSPTQFLGALGGTGLTALVGLLNVVDTKAGETVVVSGAAGATGSMAVQIAKHVIGCKEVIGIAGTDEKCRWVESIGADVCINYKKSNWKDQLGKAAGGQVDVYFDNVGGEQLDFMLTQLKRNGRISACGAISDYNKGEKTGLKNWARVITQRLNIKGFIVSDYLGDGNLEKLREQLSDAAQSGKIKVGSESETVVDTKFEEVPNTWVKLFDGSNTGKLVTKVVQ